MYVLRRKFDVIIIGGGPNGILAGAYLSRAGLKVCVLEKKMEMGGGLLTEEVNYGGIYHNTHAIYMPMIDYAPAIKDLEIETKHMVDFIFPELQLCMLGTDGSTISLYNDPKKTAESFARYSKKDAEEYLKLSKKFEGWMADFLGPYTYVQPKPTLEIAIDMEKLEMGREMFAMTEKTPRELVEEWFDHDKVRALMLNAICFWGLDPEQSGLGYLVPLYLNRSYNYRLVKRGSHQLAQAMMRDMLQHNATLLTVQVIDKIVVENGKVTGVETMDGDIFEADVVISTLDLHQTFLKYVGEDKLPKDFVDSIKMWMWEKHSHLSVNVSIDNPAPVELKAGAKEPALNKSLIYILGCDSVGDYMADIKAIENGEVGSIMYLCFPTSFDPDQIRLKDKNTALIQKHVPYDIKKGKTWDKYSWYDKDKLGKEIIQKAWEHVSNYTMDDVLAFSVSTPFDIENKFLDMVKGSIKQGEYFPLQMGYMRPNEECSMHRSPIKGLYMGGACTFPGGTVLLANGFLAADAVCEDLGIKKWWGVPDCVKKAREKGIPL